LSIPGNSVLRRILEEVLSQRAPADLRVAERGETPEAQLELWRTTAAHRPPFATSLHFWAHTLRRFLGERGRDDLFAPFAGHCLCEAVRPGVLPSTLSELGCRITPAVTIERNDAYRIGYRMIDQPELASWVAERGGTGEREGNGDGDAEFVALFFVRPAWLAKARPLPLEPIEFVEPA
jgi:hypothetical protein